MTDKLREAAEKLVHAVGTLQLDKIEPEMCCDAGAGGTITCGCYGRPINPEFYVVEALEGLRAALADSGTGPKVDSKHSIELLATVLCPGYSHTARGARSTKDAEAEKPCTRRLRVGAY